jgi:small subunit ribosomal protein S17
MTYRFIAAAREVTRELHGVVVSAGLMQKTVKVRVGLQTWNNDVQKVFPSIQAPDDISNEPHGTYYQSHLNHLYLFGKLTSRASTDIQETNKLSRT